jgi:uncharacterized protein
MPISDPKGSFKPILWAGTFIVLAIIVTFVGGALAALYLSVPVSIRRAHLALLAGNIAPAFIALFLAAAEQRYDGIKRLLSPILSWRVRIGWYLAALALPTLVGLFAVELRVIQNFVLGERVTGELRPLWVIYYMYATLRVGLFTSWLMFFQMIGWVGYCVPRLQRTYGALTSAGVLGIGFAIMAEVTGLFVPSMFIQSGWVVPCLLGSAVWLIWIYNSTNGSLLLAMLMATFLNANIVLLYLQNDLAIASMAIVLIAVVLILRFGAKTLSFNSTRVQW